MKVTIEFLFHYSDDIIIKRPATEAVLALPVPFSSRLHQHQAWVSQMACDTGRGSSAAEEQISDILRTPRTGDREREKS